MYKSENKKKKEVDLITDEDTVTCSIFLITYSPQPIDVIFALLRDFTTMHIQLPF